MNELWAALSDDEEMPLVSAVSERFVREGLDLSNCILVAVQHLFSSSVPVFEHLARMNLPFDQMFIVGKVYSAHPAVEWRLRDLGAHVYSAAPGHDREHDEELQYEDRLRADIRPIINEAVALFDSWSPERRDRGRILILDDGGLAISTAWRDHRRLGKTFACIEQTRRGAKIIRGHQLATPFPIVNVAESSAKLDLEAPLIGESVVRCLEDRFREDSALPLPQERGVLVVGFGTVGQAVADAYRSRNVRVLVADSDSRSLRRARVHGSDLRGALNDVALAVGCTGATWLVPDMLRDLELVLASASTADVEFGSVLKLGTGRYAFPDEVEEQGNADSLRTHANYQLATPYESVSVLNSGYPCNFDGSLDPIPRQAIQLTRALILGGVCAAFQSTEMGLTALRPDLDSFIASEFTSMAPTW